MNLEKQRLVMSILKTGIYEVDCVNAKVYANRRRGKVLLKTHLLPTRYEQLTIFKGRHTGVKVILYLHQLVYMAEHGMFDPEWEIDHEDRNVSNNCGYNLVAKTKKANGENKNKAVCPNMVKRIRSEEIDNIKQLVTAGNSQASIARQLGLNRLSVRYVIKRIEAGLPLKYA